MTHESKLIMTKNIERKIQDNNIQTISLTTSGDQNPIIRILIESYRREFFCNTFGLPIGLRTIEQLANYFRLRSNFKNI